MDILQPSSEPGLLGYMINQIIACANAGPILRNEHIDAELIEGLAALDFVVLLYPELSKLKPDGSAGVGTLLVANRETEDGMQRSISAWVECEATAHLIMDQVRTLQAYS
jgi:hypothetical protein